MNKKSFIMKLSYVVVFALAFIMGCQNKKEKSINVQSIVNKAIETSGKESFINAEISFTFRDKTYISKGNCNYFVYNRVTGKNDSIIKDVYKPGENLKRYVQDSLIQIADTTAQKYAESINSVLYFVQLPYRLNDEAVNKKYLGLDSIKNKVYHKIAVNFDQKGGGIDYEDNYLYWFDKDNYKLDYLAYSFKVNGGGIRFREAYNERYIDSIRFVDYKNYKPKSNDITLDKISKAFENNELELLSLIENKNINVKNLKKNCK